MSGQKRSFPYHTVVPDIDLKRRAIEGVNPGQESSNARVFEHPNLEITQTSTSTDFSSWTDAQLKGFLDQRGEDYDDCQDRQQLVQRAAHCEYTTGLARNPVDDVKAEEEDPLDAFMAEIQQTAAEQPLQPKAKKAELEEEEDNVADFMEARRRNGTAAGVYVAEGYNSDDEVYATDKAMEQGEEEEAPEARQSVGPLAPVDHNSASYEPFAKDFYTPVHKIASMTPGEVNSMRRQLGIRVSGFDAPGPVELFEQCGLDTAMMAVIRKAGYLKPTAIQSQALPAALSGRDILGIAKTGSGKTAAFILPMVVHIQDQPELEKGEGPIGVICAPTRELAEQIHKEARKFAKPYNMRIAAGIGGLSKYEQFKDLKAGSDAAVCTPGRLIDLIKMKACTLRRTTYLVFDEADRMFDLGFEPQVRSIIGQVRPDRQTMLFSATMPNKVERLVRDALTSPVRITVGEVGAANEDIKQVVEIVDEQKKMDWLIAKLPELVDTGEVLVFANQIVRVDELTQKLKAAGHRVVAIHGDMDQHSRAQALKEFSAGRQHVLVATDVAARGLDIKSIKNVVNLDAAKDIDTHVHRVGRTGRAGDKEGTAYTLLTPKQSHFAVLLVTSMVAANQEISAALQALAMKDSGFRKGQTRNKAGGKFSASGAKRRQPSGGAGIGFGPTRDDPMTDLYGSREGFKKGADLSATTVEPQPGVQQSKPVAAGPAGFAPPSAPTGFPAPPSANPVLGGPQQPQAATGIERPPPPQQPAAPDPSGGVFGGQGLKGIMQNRFRSQFVTSGTTGGDVGQKATIIAPKQAVQSQAEPAAVPSFLAKKMNPPPANEQAQKAIAAARAIAARLAGADQSSDQGYPQPPQASSFAATASHPPGIGMSASAYPDLSRDYSDRDSHRDRDRLDRRTSEGRDRDRGDRGHESSRESSRGGLQQGVLSSGYRDRGVAEQHRSQVSNLGAGLGASASSYPELSRDRERSRANGFSSGPSAGFSAPAPPVPPAAAAAQTGNPYAAHYGQPQVVQPSNQPVANPYVQAYTAPPQPRLGPGANASIQSSIAAAQAIAARLTAQAGGTAGMPPALLPAAPPQGRLGGVGSTGTPVDSVQASIEAAKAVAARFASASGGGSGSALGNQQTATSGQWAWGKG